MAIALKPKPASRRPRHRVALPSFMLPQKATLVDTAPVGDDWLHKMKFDGSTAAG